MGLVSSEASQISILFLQAHEEASSPPFLGCNRELGCLKERLNTQQQETTSLLAACWVTGSRHPGVFKLADTRVQSLSLAAVQPSGSLGAGWWQRQGPLPSPRSPGSLLTSHVSCFLEILVQLRSRLTGCLLMMPLSAWGVMDLHLLKSIFVHNLLSQHLGTRTRLKGESREAHGTRDDQRVAWLRGGAQPWHSPSCRTRPLCLVSPGFPKHVGRLLRVSGHPGMPRTAPAGFCCHVTRL